MYIVIFQKDIKKKLKKIPKKDARSLLEAIQQLATEPRPRGAEKLVNRKGYRIRVGNHRIVYGVDDGKLVISVIGADHRKDVYR